MDTGQKLARDSNNTETGASLHLDLLGTALGITFFIVYLTTNGTMPDFRRQLDALKDAVSGTEGRILVGGDFNGRALEWGMPQPDSRVKGILEMAARTGFVVLNTGSTPTFRRSGCEGSIPDITFALECLASSVDGWRVQGDFWSVHRVRSG